MSTSSVQKLVALGQHCYSEHDKLCRFCRSACPPARQLSELCCAPQCLLWQHLSDLLGTGRGHQQPSGGWKLLGSVVSRQYIYSKGGRGRAGRGGKRKQALSVLANARCTSNKVAIIWTRNTTSTSCCSVCSNVCTTAQSQMDGLSGKEGGRGERLMTMQESCLFTVSLHWTGSSQSSHSENQKPMANARSWFGVQRKDVKWPWWTCYPYSTWQFGCSLSLV